MDYTDNYNLKKPADTDERKISDLNDNADIIDAALNTLATTEATTSARGMMSAADKTKLNGIAASANNYSLPLAANGTRGGAQIGYSQNAKNYPVQLSGEKMYVNVPWTDTTYSDVTTSAHGLMTAADKSNLDSLKNKVSNLKTPSAALGASYTVAASGTYKLNLKTTLDGNIPSGYKLLGIVGFRTGNDNVVPVRIEYQNNESSLTLRNLSNTSQNGTWGVDILIIPT